MTWSKRRKRFNKITDFYNYKLQQCKYYEEELNIVHWLTKMDFAFHFCDHPIMSPREIYLLEFINKIRYTLNKRKR